MAVRMPRTLTMPQPAPAQLSGSTCSRVCMTCTAFRYRIGPEGIPLLFCQWQVGVIPHGLHLTHRCPDWTHGSQQSFSVHATAAIT